MKNMCAKHVRIACISEAVEKVQKTTTRLGEFWVEVKFITEEPKVVFYEQICSEPQTD